MTIDTKEFRDLVMAVRHEEWNFDSSTSAIGNLIAYIDARLAHAPAVSEQADDAQAFDAAIAAGTLTWDHTASARATAYEGFKAGRASIRRASSAPSDSLRLAICNIPLPVYGSNSFQHGFVSAKEAVLDLLTKRASTTAAPASAQPADDLRTDYLADRGYLDGLRAGWNLGVAGENAKFDAIVATRGEQLQEARRELRQGEQPVAAAPAGLTFDGYHDSDENYGKTILDLVRARLEADPDDMKEGDVFYVNAAWVQPQEWRVVRAGNPMEVERVSPPAAAPAAPVAQDRPQRIDEAVATLLVDHTKLNEDGIDEFTVRIARMLNHVAERPATDEEMVGDWDAAPVAQDVIAIAATIFDFKPHKQTEEAKAKYLRFAAAIMGAPVAQDMQEGA